MTKTNWRRKAKSQKYERGYLSKSNAAITSRTVTLPEFQAADTVFCYVAEDKMVDTRALIKYALRAGKTVAVPGYEEDGSMTARIIYAYSELNISEYGVALPPMTAPILHKEDIDLAVLPCLCADRECNRIGRGLGYWDTFLADYTGKSVVLCRGQLLMDETLPTEPHDRKADMVLTENETVRR